MNRFSISTARGLIVCVLVLAAIPAFARKWTDTSNGQTVDGDFQRVIQGRVQIKTGAGNAFIPYRNLSKDDKDFIKKQSDGHKHNEQTPPKPKPAETEAAKELKAADKDKPVVIVVEVNGVKGPIKLGPERKWTDVKGRSVQARFIGIEGTKIVLFYGDKPQQHALPFENFVKVDQEYVRKEMIARGEGNKVPGAPPSNANPAPTPAPTQIAQATPPANSATGPQPATPKEVKPEMPKVTEPKPSEPKLPAVAAQAPVQPPAAVVSTPHPTEPSHRMAEPAKPTSAPPVQTLVAEPNATKTTVAKPTVVASENVATESVPPAPVKSKVCSACGHKLPETITAGNSCPNCGAYLQYEKTDEGRVQVSSTFRSLGAPVGLASLFGVIAIAAFRVRSYAQH